MLAFIILLPAVCSTDLKNANIYFQPPPTVGENPQEASGPEAAAAGDSQ